MTFTYDLTTDRGKVRLLIPDRDTVTAANQVFTDDEIDAFLSVEGSSVKRAAALGLETMASNEAYVQKVIKLLDLQTNGAATAAALMKRAAALRDQAEYDEAALDGGAWDVAEQVQDVFSERERLYKQWQRQGYPP